MTRFIIRNVLYFLIMLNSVRIKTIALFIPDKTVSPCFGLTCGTHGTIEADTCQCICYEQYSGPVCEQEKQTSAWPSGSYSMLSTVFGCPESEIHGWTTGHINLTASSDTGTRHWFPEQFRLLGPYHLQTIQLNFCSRTGDKRGIPSTLSWPEGSYCLFRLAGFDCPQGFQEDSLQLKNYSVWNSDIWGVVPEVKVTDVEVRFTLCCRNEVHTSPIKLPSTFPFYLHKRATYQPCMEVTDMTAKEEVFSLSKTRETDIYFNMTLCYYEPQERQECVFTEDNGASYRGRKNITSEGLPCQMWEDVLESLELQDPKHKYHDYELQYEANYCRQTSVFLERAWCAVNFTRHYCDIPYCQSEDEPPNIISRNIYRSAPAEEDSRLQNIADGLNERPAFVTDTPYVEPWLQVDLQEDFEIFSITAKKSYHWGPNLYRHVITFVSRHQWDFLSFGAYVCNGPYSTSINEWFRFQCRRPLIGSYVTLQNFVHYDPEVMVDKQWRLEIAELFIRGKATGCGKSLGVKTGGVKDFQISASTNGEGFNPFDARLNREMGWCAKHTDLQPYIQVDLLTPMTVQGVVLQGWTEGRASLIPDNFTLEYGVREDNLTLYTDGLGHTKVFQVDQTEVASASQIFLLSRQLLTRVVRINLLRQETPVCVKFDVIGCPRKVNYDLKCEDKSTTIGLQYLPSYISTLAIEGQVSHNTTIEACRENYLANRKEFSAYSFKNEDNETTCTYNIATRYNRHSVGYLQKGYSERSQYGQLMCVEDISRPEECGGLITEKTIITSPSYPFYYGEKMNCTWTITLKPGSFVSVEMIDVNLAAEEELFERNDKSGYFDCEDTLSIYDRERDEDALVANITGSPFNTLESPRYISSSNQLEINLVSCPRYGETTARGFTIKVGDTDCSGCGQGRASCSKQSICRDNCGYISSMDFPNFYSVSASCYWLIQGQMGQYVTVTFDMIDVIADEDCEGDYVSLYDLDLSHRRSLIGQYCKIKRPIGEIKSSWHMMAVEFYSNFEKTGRGFLLKYRLEAIELKADSENSPVVCYTSWYKYEHMCYSFNTDSDGVSWFDAERLCVEKGGHLVSIGDGDEMMFLHSTILNNNLFTEQEAYIGLRKFGSGEFRWTDDKPLTHTEWYGGDQDSPRQPDGGEDETCTMMKIADIKSTANWHDVPCAFDKVKQYICETKGLRILKTVDTDISIGSQLPSPVNSTVPDGYFFLCGSGEHISAMFVCDTVNDCIDGSDEEKCIAGCPQTMFTCGDGSCVDMMFYCDHKQHCPGGEDEHNCEYNACGSEEWMCDCGQCISSHHRCDLLVHCVDGSDENECESCPASFFQCYDGQCLPPGRVCDGFVDCGGQYREDEGPQCTTNSQTSCKAWYALGARVNGRYSINKKGSSDYYDVQCLFNTSVDTVTTIVHHSMEDIVVSGNFGFNETVHYSVPDDVIDYVMTSSENCYQFLKFDCHQAYEIFTQYSSWFDRQGTVRMFKSSVDNNCSCILDDACTHGNKVCGCDRTREELFWLHDNAWLTDSGYIRDMARLPITRLSINWTLFLGRVRHFIGPLICTERANATTTYLRCKSGVVVDSSHRCIMDFDVYNQHKGCRDLTHIENCGDFECPDDFIKCPSSFCLPIRLVCDGIANCVDGSDEQGCSNISCPGRFRCHGEHQVCLPWSQVCDGVQHCVEGEDEYFCDTVCEDGCTCRGAHMVCTGIFLEAIVNVPEYTRVLNVSRSKDTILKNGTFSRMESLARLDLAYLGVEELEPMCFGGLRNLIILDISYNKLKVIPMMVFRDMKKLENLVLTGNHIVHIAAGSFAGLENLPLLDLSNMDIALLSDNSFHGLSNLEILNLSGNAITAIDDGAFKGLNNLQQLDLRWNAISDFTADVFNDLQSLTHLYNDRFVFCCVKPANVIQCLPEADEFSSCSDLMRNEMLRISLWVLGFIALAGNTITLVYRCIWDRKCLHRSNDFFVANLAVSDFLMGVYMIIIASADVFYRGQYSLNDVLWRKSRFCHFAGFMSAFSSETSVMFLCMITMERVLVIKFPFKDFGTIIQTYYKRISLIVWLLGMVFAGAPLLPLSYFSGSFYSRSGVCLALPLTRDRPPGWEYSMAVFILWNFVCFALIAVGQAAIYHEVKSSHKIRKGKSEFDLVLARKLSFIVLTDFVCWFPVCVMGIMALTGHVTGSEVYAWVAVFVLPINSALNPIIYTLSTLTARKQRKKRHSLVAVTASVQPKTRVRQRLHEEFMCISRPADSICLADYLSCMSSLEDVETIVGKVSEFLSLLHASSMIYGDLNTSSLYLVTYKGSVKDVITTSLPMAATSDEDYSRDILDFGRLVTKLMKAHSTAKTKCQQTRL